MRSSPRCARPGWGPTSTTRSRPRPGQRGRPHRGRSRRPMTSRWQPAGERPLRVGLAGLGSMGRNHLRILSSRPDIRLVAIADPVAEALAPATAASGAQGFAEPLAMIEEAELDAVVIAAPTTAHVALACAAIERGVAVLVEKPLAGTVDEAMQIVAAARVNGVPVQVGHVERFNPAVLELGRLIEAG